MRDLHVGSSDAGSVRRVAEASGCFLQVKKDEKELEVGFGQGPTFQLPVRGVQKTEDGTVKTVTVMLFGDRDNRRKVGHPQMPPCGNACDRQCHGKATLPGRVQRQVRNRRSSLKRLLHSISHGIMFSGSHQQHVCQPVEAFAHPNSTGCCSDCCAGRRESSSTRPWKIASRRPSSATSRLSGSGRPRWLISCGYASSHVGSV